jgi:enoyl-CoA hydratase
MDEPINLFRSPGAITIVFNRPEIRSPISLDVICALERLFDDIEVGDRLGRLVFTGRKGVFASGADLNEIAGLEPSRAAAFAERGQALMNRIAGLPFETVAAVNGFCFGGALDLALACTTRIASAQAQFAHPGARLGIITGWGGTQRLPRLVGQAAAMEMFLMAEPITAETALRIGLIDRIVDATVEEFVSF